MHTIKLSLAEQKGVAHFMKDVTEILAEEGMLVTSECNDEIVCTLDKISLTIKFAAGDKLFSILAPISNIGFIGFKDTVIKCPDKSSIALLEKLAQPDVTEANNIHYITKSLRLVVAEIICKTYPRT